MSKAFAAALEKMKTLLMPVKCAVCGDATLLGIPVCGGCLPRFCSLFTDLCPRCRKRPEDCSCRRDVTFLFYYFTPESKSVIGSIKRRMNRETAEFFALLAAKRLEGMTFDCVTYPPRSSKNIAKYGYDQSKTIAEAFSAITGIPTADALSRVRRTADQKALSADKRRANAAGAYIADPAKLAGYKRVLLIDDVCTTGATLYSCKKALKDACPHLTAVTMFAIATTASIRDKRAVGKRYSRRTRTMHGGAFVYKRNGDI